MGTAKVINWTRQWPYYQREDNKIVHRGFFERDRPLITTYYLQKAKLGILDHEFKEEDFQFMCDVIHQAKQNLLNQFPKARFYTASHPFWRIESEYQKIKSCLNEYNIPVIDMGDLFKKSPYEKVHITDDGHARPWANEQMAKKILSEIRKD